MWNVELLFYRFGDAISCKNRSRDISGFELSEKKMHGPSRTIMDRERERCVCIYIYICTCNYQHIIATLASRTAVGMTLLTDDLLDEFLSVDARYTVHFL